jgi:hypothetical protein
MKPKQLAWLLAAGLLTMLVGLRAVQQTAAQTQGTDNLLVNPGFEGGHHHQDGIPELTVPDGWRIHWLDGVEFLGSEGPAARPESVNWFIGDAPANEQGLFFRDGSYAMKVFKGGRPMYAAISQDVNGLEVGRRYRLVAPIYIDIVASYNGASKVAPARLDSGLVRLGAGPAGSAWLDEATIAYSGWWTAESISPFYLAYPVFIHDFTATQPNMTVWIEFGSRHVHQNNGFFLDTMGLYTLDEVDDSVGQDPPPGSPPVATGPTPTPFPTPTPRPDGAIVHVVQVGDSLWSIAIRYASALGMSAEEALPIIRELNDNPAFVQVGQEILVALPDESAEPKEVAEEAPTAESSDATASETEEPVVSEPTATPEATAEAIPTDIPQPELIAAVEPASSICVSVFNDLNGNGTAEDAEGLLPEAVLTLSRSSGPVATYVTDGINEPYCFEELESDTYQITFSQPPEFQMTTTGNWAISVSDGDAIQVQFGARYDANAVAAAQTESAVEAAQDDDVGTVESAPESEGLSSQLGTIALGIAIVLVLLAGVGFVLLRRS